jgi:CBS domain-containing protein
MRNDIALFLHNHPPFNLIPFERVQHISDTLKIEQFLPGHDILIQHGTPSEYIYIIRYGSVELLRQNDDSVLTVFDVLDEGDAFGHLSLIYGSPPNATVRTREETLVYMVPPDVFHQVRQEYPMFGRLFDASSIGQLRQVFLTQDAGTYQELRTTLGELISRAPVYVDPETSIRDAARKMRQYGVGSLLVNVHPAGIMTERDLRNRVLADGLSDTTPVKQVMTRPILTLSADSLIFEGLMIMLQHHIRHLPITEGGEIKGVVSHTDILRHQSQSPLFLPRQLSRAQTIDDFKTYVNQVTATVGSLMKAGTRIHDIGRVVAVANDALVNRLLRDTEAELGAPPCPYAWLVLGSEGRYEQMLHTDQDNALVYDDHAPAGADEYFAALAERVVGQLIESGIPPCPGNIMATNPRWQQPLHVWQNYFDDWIHVPDEEALMHTAIFFDYRQVYGTLDAEQALRPIVQEASKSGLFLRRLSKGALRNSPPLGFFRNLVVEHDGEGRDVIDLKVRGTALIVDLARLYALSAGRTETNTIGRLRVAVSDSDLSEKGAEELIAAFELISQIRLRHQYEQVRQDEKVTNYVPMAMINALERRELKSAMKAIGTVQGSVSSLFGTSLIG